MCVYRCYRATEEKFKRETKISPDRKTRKGLEIASKGEGHVRRAIKDELKLVCYMRRKIKFKEEVF